MTLRGQGIGLVRAFASFTHFLSFFLCFNQRKTSKEGANEFFGLRNQGIRTDPKTEGNSVVRLENRGSGAIAP
jgi:hypothetical protein